MYRSKDVLSREGSQTWFQVVYLILMTSFTCCSCLQCGVREVYRNLYQCNPGRMSKYSYARMGIETKIYESLFHRVCGGIYLEIGARNGIEASNTYALMSTANWTGILIEPVMEEYKDLCFRRPKDIQLNTVVCRSSHVNLNSELGGKSYISHQYTGGTELPSLTTRYRGPTCSSLTSILTSAGLDHIDFFSLDVEGSEMEVLRTIDFHKISFGVICVEAFTNRPIKRARIHTFLVSVGYVQWDRIGQNDVFISNLYWKMYHLQEG